ncbi:MAG TPA: dTMP kinase [Candidatus Moranbacteria bacterium]|nr:dTMP kinase [Candidatus Moranbacteria bacterium]
MIIEIEGIDGVGKTTQCELLRDHFRQQGKKAVVVKDLKSTKFGRDIKEFLTSSESQSMEVELFSFLACKSQLFSQVITPAVSCGEIVICDRGIGSFISYFESLGFSRSFLCDVINLAINGLRPQLTIFLDVMVEETSKRKANKLEQSKFDLMSDDFFRKQRAVFLSLSKESSWAVIDGSLSIKETHLLITRYVGNIL